MNIYSLRKIQHEDLPLILHWRNQSKIRKNMKNNSIITEKQHLCWFEKLQTSTSMDVQIFCINSKPVGVVSFIEIDETCLKQCQWGIYIGDSGAPRAAGTMMGYRGLEYVFATYAVETVIAEVLEDNVVSKNFHKKLGFKEMPEFHKRVLIENRGINFLGYHLTRDDWEKGKVDIFNEAMKKLERNDNFYH